VVSFMIANIPIHIMRIQIALNQVDREFMIELFVTNALMLQSTHPATAIERI
jgi:hypothetical protein